MAESLVAESLVAESLVRDSAGAGFRLAAGRKVALATGHWHGVTGRDIAASRRRRLGGGT